MRLPYFSDYKTHPPIWEENGGASYSPNVAYVYTGEILCYFCLLVFKDFIYSFIYLFERGEEREKYRERNINVWLMFL